MRRPTGWGTDAVVDTIADVVRELAHTVGIEPGEFAAIGVGMPGQVAEASTTVTHAVNLGIDALDLDATIGARFGVPVHAENDVKAAALGAAALHGHAGALAYLNLGTGIAAGVVNAGRLWRGARGTAVRVIVLSTDVETVVLGGGVSALGDRMLTLVVTELEASAAASPFLRSLHLADRVELLPAGSPAGALGAALIGADIHEQETVAHG